MFGKGVEDLQSDIEISNSNVVSGTLENVTGYTGFSTVTAQRSGHYLALHCGVPYVHGVTYSVVVSGGTDESHFVEGTGVVVCRVSATTQTIKITASKLGYESEERTLTLTGLTLDS